MVFTLQRYIFRELFKVFLLATIGLTLILSLGSILQPIQEFGVGPRQVIHILLYFMPITLTFVLPMSALFASALTYGRFASDNELDACRASGVSLLTMVYPGLVLAVLVATANLVLSFHVMPLFVHMAERSLKADAKQILIRNIQRRGYYKLPPDNRYMIYADYADNDTLLGIVVVQNEGGAVKKMWTADRARINFNLGDETNEVRLDVYGLRQMGEGDDLWIWIGTASLPFEFGSLLGDDIAFKRVNEIKQIRANLMLFEPVAKLARDTHAQLVTEMLVKSINEDMDLAGAEFFELASDTHLIRFAAASCALGDENEIVFEGGTIIVHEYERSTGRYLRTLRCETGPGGREGGVGSLYVANSAGGMGLNLVLRKARVEATGRLMTYHSFRDLALPEKLRGALQRGDILQTAASDDIASTLGAAPSRVFLRSQAALKKQMRRTLIDIAAEVNSRLVFGIGCVPMIMIGIGLGIINRGSHLLSAFGASCVPAAVLIVTIISGKHVTENTTTQGISGIAVMWAGLASLLVLAWLLYAKLSRN